MNYDHYYLCIIINNKLNIVINAIVKQVLRQCSYTLKVEMSRKLIPLVLFLCFSLVVVDQFFSDSTNTLNIDSSQPLLNLAVVAYQAAPVRENPPSGFFRRFGKMVSETTPDARYVISNAKILPHGFTTQTWVELMNDSEDKPIGWVYWGEEQTPEQSANFILNRSSND